MRRQHQELDRPGVHQVQDGSGEQGKMKETGSEIICGAPTTLAVKGKIMMMIKMNFITVRVKYSTKTKLRRTITKVGVNMCIERSILGERISFSPLVAWMI